MEKKFSCESFAFGDMISVGRSVLLLGSREDIAKRVSKLQPNSHLSRGDSGLDLSGKVEDFAKKAKHDSRLQARIYDAEPPELPSRLSPGQAAQLSELLEYVHIRLRELVSDIHADRKGEVVELDIRQWQYLLDLQARVSEYLRNIGHPNDFLNEQLLSVQLQSKFSEAGHERNAKKTWQTPALPVKTISLLLAGTRNRESSIPAKLLSTRPAESIDEVPLAKLQFQNMRQLIFKQQTNRFSTAL